jgi:excisionase family DNA binding protein
MDNNPNASKENGHDQLLLTVKQVAEILNISARSVYNSTGRKSTRSFPIPACRVGRRAIRFRRSDVLAFIDNLRPLK